MLRNFVHQRKHDDLVSEVELTEANTMYARVRCPSGRETNMHSNAQGLVANYLLCHVSQEYTYAVKSVLNSAGLKIIGFSKCDSWL